MLVLILATWTTNVGNAYSAGIAVVNIFKMKDDKRAAVTAVCGIIGILLSLGGIVYYFVDFLSPDYANLCGFNRRLLGCRAWKERGLGAV